MAQQTTSTTTVSDCCHTAAPVASALATHFSNTSAYTRRLGHLQMGTLKMRLTICINNRWRSSLQDVRAYRGADVGSDHNLVIGKIHLKLKKATKPEVKKTYATETLKEQTSSENFCMETRNRFAALEHSTDLEEQLQMFVSGGTDSAAKILEKRRGTNKERWISCETWDLIDERKRTKNARDQTKDSHTRMENT